GRCWTPPALDCPPVGGTFWFQIFIQAPSPEIWSETISGGEEVLAGKWGGLFLGYLLGKNFPRRDRDSLSFRAGAREAWGRETARVIRLIFRPVKWALLALKVSGTLLPRHFGFILRSRLIRSPRRPAVASARPKAFAVLKLMTNSNLVDRCTGRS